MTDSEIINKLKERIESLEKRVTGLEDPSSPNLTTHNSLESKILEKIDDIGIQNLVLLALRIKPKQSRSNLKIKLESWQKPVGSWFRGGNFKNRLLTPSQIIRDGINDKKEDLYSLGSKGIKTVKKLIEKYDLT
ncbi:MAG: hypothetical protein IIA82_03760 [Thaumarchaeota archaeon]|nr:hypothetical protein [Nitrososphaerota archaeon]